MTRTYAAQKLLEHGPLTFADFLVITGWQKGVANKVLCRLRTKGLSTVTNIGGERHHALC